MAFFKPDVLSPFFWHQDRQHPSVLTLVHVTSQLPEVPAASSDIVPCSTSIGEIAQLSRGTSIVVDAFRQQDLLEL